MGHLSFPGLTADVWGHKQFAYVGSLSRSGEGVQIVDVSRPARPRLVARVARRRGTSQEDVMVAPIRTRFFRGDLLATGIQVRDEDTRYRRGLDLWDVSRPRRPRHLGFWDSGPRSKHSARGVHELFLFQRGRRAYVAAAVPDSHHFQKKGDFRLIDVTNPRRPFEVSHWHPSHQHAFHGNDQSYPWGHSVSVNRAGTLAVLSAWDAGHYFLDISDPRSPKEVGRISYPEGKSHSVAWSDDERLLLTTDEMLRPIEGPRPWGFLRLWDIASPAAPSLVGEFATRNCRQFPAREDGIYSAHNAVVRGTTAYMSWFRDGIRIADISDPSAPREIASFVPPGAFVWGVYVQGNRILASDLNSGLYVLRHQR